MTEKEAKEAIVFAKQQLDQAHDAVDEAQTNLDEAYQWAMDLKNDADNED